MIMDLKESHALVTGGSAGIGRYLVERLAADARRVAVFDKDEAALAQLASQCPGISRSSCELTDPVAVKEAVENLANDGFEFDILINNAGLIHSAPLINLLEKTDRVHSPETWEKVVAANLSSVFYVTGSVVDQMLRRRKKGVVINMSSISATGNPGQSAYAAAKAGVNALTLTWAKELGALGLRFVSIAPGFLDTASTRKALSESLLTKLQQQIPLGRLGTVEHIYQTVRFIVENN